MKKLRHIFAIAAAAVIFTGFVAPTAFAYEEDSVYPDCPTEIKVNNKVSGKFNPNSFRRRVNYRQEFTCNGVLHNDGDNPALIETDGSKYYYKHGKKHRDYGLPAVEYANGNKEWWENGQRHRDGGCPAVVRKGGYDLWYIRDVRQPISKGLNNPNRGACPLW